jgi:hypothetical protein
MSLPAISTHHITFTINLTSPVRERRNARSTVDELVDKATPIVENIFKTAGAPRIPGDNFKKTFDNATQHFHEFSMGDLETMVNEMHSNVSFWGSRVVSASGYKGTIPLSVLASRVTDLYNKAHWENISGNRFVRLRDKRLIGDDQHTRAKAILEKINGFYAETDRIKQTRNVFTRFLCSIIDRWNANINPGHSLSAQDILEGMLEHGFSS